MDSKNPDQLRFTAEVDAFTLRRERIVLRKKALRIGAIAALAFTVIGAIGFYGWLKEIGVFDITDEQLQTIASFEPGDNSQVFDRNGQRIGEFFSRYQIHIPYSELPPKLIEAILAIEDRSFFTHNGIDTKAIVRAVVARLIGKSTKQGASTITQQVVRHFLLTRERTLARKVKEAAMAIRLTSMLSKERVLELYVNNMFLGNGAYGVGAAAVRYFGKHISELDVHEYALIAGLFQSPSRYNPIKYPDRAKKRQRQVLVAMVNAKYLQLAEAKALVRKPLVYQFYNPLNLKTAPYFIDFVQEETRRILDKNIKNQGLRIFTTLDSTVQEQLGRTIEESKSIFTKADNLAYKSNQAREKSVVETAMLVTDPNTGEILAMIGGRDYRQSQFNRAVNAKRQPGSLFKPIVYSLALQRGLKWSDLFYVSPVAVDNYRPKNFSSSYLTETTLFRAFYQSINTVAIELGYRLGLDEVLLQARKLGIKTKLKKELGTVIGGSEVTMLDLATMYGAFANGGSVVRPSAIIRITDRAGKVLYEAPPLEKRKQQVLSPQVAYLMMQGMKSVLRHGTAAQYGELAEVAAGKTGTSNDSRDNWFAGYTPHLLAITWVGTDQAQGFYDAATGTSLALPIWANFIKKASGPASKEVFTEPVGIVNDRVNSRFGYRDKNGIKMYFIQGQEPTLSDSSLRTLTHSTNYRSIFDP